MHPHHDLIYTEINFLMFLQEFAKPFTGTMGEFLEKRELAGEIIELYGYIHRN